MSYLKYYPNCFCLQVTLVDYTFFCRSLLLLDASYDEERISEGQMVIAMNKHREICALHMSGTHLLHKDQVHVQRWHIDYYMGCGYGAVSSLKPRI